MLNKIRVRSLIKKQIFIVVACISSCSFAASAVRPAKPILDIQHWKTTNGVPVYFVRTPNLPMLDVRMIFSAGSAYDENNWGLAKLVNSSLNQGTSKLTAKQISDNFEKVGAKYSTNVTKDMGVVSLRTLIKPQYLSAALSTFHSVLTNPTFPGVAIKLQKAQMQASINYRNQSPRNIAKDNFFDIVFNNSAYAHPTIGTLSTVSAITPKLARKFYSKYYVANNASLLLVGAITRQAAHTISEQLTNGFVTGKKADKMFVPSISIPSLQDKKHINFKSNQSAIYLGYKGITRSNPFYFPLLVGSHILGGSTMTSLLFQNIREKQGLTYGVYSVIDSLKFGGAFYIALNTKNKSRRQALTAVKKTLDDFVLNGPSASQLQLAKDFLIRSFPLNLSGNAKILSVLTYLTFYNRPLAFLDTWQQRVSAVTKSQIQQIFDQITHQHMIVVTVGGHHT